MLLDGGWCELGRGDPASPPTAAHTAPQHRAWGRTRAVSLGLKGSPPGWLGAGCTGGGGGARQSRRDHQDGGSRVSGSMPPSWGRCRDGAKQEDTRRYRPQTSAWGFPPAHGGGVQEPHCCRLGLGAAPGPSGWDVPVTAQAGGSVVGGPHPCMDPHVGWGLRPPRETRSHFPWKFCKVFGEMRLFLF